MCPQKVAVYIIGHHHVKSSFGANNNSYEYYLGVFSCCQYLELYLRSKILGNLVSGDIINWLVVLCHLPQDGFENHPFSLFSSHSSSGTFGMRCWIKGIRKVSFNLGLLSIFRVLFCSKVDSCNFLTNMRAWRQNKCTFHSLTHSLTEEGIIFWLANRMQQSKAQQERKPTILERWKLCIVVLLHRRIFVARYPKSLGDNLQNCKRLIIQITFAHTGDNGALRHFKIATLHCCS